MALESSPLSARTAITAEYFEAKNYQSLAVPDSRRLCLPLFSLLQGLGLTTIS